MARDNSLSQGFEKAVRTGKHFFVGLGTRLLVHFVSLISAGIIASTVTTAGGDLSAVSRLASSSVVFTSYVGLICLFPREMAKNADWLIPTGAGLLHCVVWAAMGVPWQFTLIFGGALTWILRFLRKRTAMGWEFSALPWLLIGLYSLFSDLQPYYLTATPYWTLPVLAGLGFFAHRLHARLRVDPVHRAMLTGNAARLHKLLTANALPGPLLLPVRQLAEHITAFQTHCPTMDEEALALTRKIADHTDNVVRLGHRANFGQWDAQAGKVFAETAQLNEVLFARLEALIPPESAKKTTPAQERDDALNARLNVFRESITGLEDKKWHVSLSLQPHVDSICRTAGSILECMRTDPKDVSAGDKFLSRYLKAAHTVVDEHSRLSREGAGHESVTQVLARSGELLARLEKAFIDEHGRLLRNDTINFTAELNVLDTLLKMDGR